MADQDVDTTAAALVLQAAVDQLTQPGVVQLQRDIPQPGTTAWQLMADDKALEAELHGQLAQAAALALLAEETFDEAEEERQRGVDLEDDTLTEQSCAIENEGNLVLDRARAMAERAHEGLRLLDARRAARTRTDAPTPSLLDQLLDEIPNSGDSGGGRSSGGSRSPLALAALDAAQEIATAVGQPLDHRLAQHVRRWADDAHRFPELLQFRADTATPWPDRIRDVLDPPKRWSAAGRCPDCGNREAWTDDDAGEKVRRPAIEFDRARGTARCLRCPARWTTEAQLQQLAKVLTEEAG